MKSVLLLSIATIMLAMMLMTMGCSPTTIHTEFDPEGDFKSFRTWNWLPVDEFDSDDRRLNDPKVRKALTDVIDAALADRGYMKNPDSPDFFVIYHAALDQELNQRNIENYYEYMNYMVFAPRVTTRYTEEWDIGTIIVDIFDPESRRLIWRGTSMTEMNYQAGPRENRPIIEDAVKKMLKRFPPS